MAGQSCDISHFIDSCPPGLHLLFADGHELTLTAASVKQAVEDLWGNLDTLAPEVREAADFRRCGFCPLRAQGGICDALRPTVALLGDLDRFLSHDRVTAFYRADETSLVHAATTTMQEALKYVALLSLLRYCQNGQRYSRFFRGVIPLMPAREIAQRLYLNIYWLHGGDQQSIARAIRAFTTETVTSTQNQVRRLSLVCERDAFLNAFVAASTAVEFLTMDMEEMLDKAFNHGGRTGPP